MGLIERACLALLLFSAADGLLHSGTPLQIPMDMKTTLLNPAHARATMPVTAREKAAPPALTLAGVERNVRVQRTQQGRILRVHLASAPFPDPGRQNGYQYEDTVYPADPHYMDSSVAVFVPPGFRSNGPVDLVFFFHGWNSSIDDEQQRFDLYRQFSQSRARAILVLPELAWNAPDSFGGKLEDKGGFARMVDELLEKLLAKDVVRVPRAGNIVLAGHSGAYRVVAQILVNGDLAANVKEVWLFDALYALTDDFDDWIESTGGKFVSVSAADGQETTDVDALITSLRNDKVPLEIARDDPDNDARTMRSRVLFLHSASDHYGVVYDRDEFRRLLKASPSLRSGARDADPLARQFPPVYIQKAQLQDAEANPRFQRAGFLYR